MRPLRKFLRLPSADRRLLVKAVLLVAAVRLGLWLAPLRTLRRLLARVAAAPAGPGGRRRPSAERLVWAVAAAGRRVPKATCLTQALAAQTLLARQGYPCRLHIGVARDGGGRFEAHAWVESKGAVVIGGAETGRYTSLFAFEAETV